MSAIDEITLEDLREDQQMIAEIIGMDKYIELVKRFAGTQIYIPKLDDFERNLRNKQICEEFNGYNYEQLAVKYGLTSTMIRIIVKDRTVQIKSGVSKDQISMFDFI